MPYTEKEIRTVLDSCGIDPKDIICQLRQNKEHKATTPYWKECVDVYFHFHNVERSCDPVFGLNERKDMKELIEYLKTQSKRPPDETLEYIFQNWNKLDTFHQQLTAIGQMRKYLGSIIGQIKNNRLNKNDLVMNGHIRFIFAEKFKE